MPDTTWKTITVPKGLYLPTTAADGSFKNSGIRVEPSDKIEILPNSCSLRVNGVEFTLLIPTDTLRLDATNCVVLDKPALPVGSLGSGDGLSSARVGRIGDARLTPTYSGEGTPLGFRRSAASQQQPGMTLGDDLDEVTSSAAAQELQDIDPTTFDSEDATLQEITLKDGTKAFVHLYPDGTRSAPFRLYAGIGTDPKEAMRLLAEQNATATSVAGKGTHPAPAVRQPTTEPRTPDIEPVRAARASPAASSGNIHLDGFLAAKTGSQGYPLGQITCLSAPATILDSFQGPVAPATSLEAAFARIHLAKGNPVVFVRLGEIPTDTLRLELAELIPTLAEVVQKHGAVALVLLTPPWNPMPALLTYIPTLCLSLAPHASDPRFVTATCSKPQVPQGTSVSFPT